MGTTAARGIALFFGLFGLVNSLAGLADRGLDANGWWIGMGRPGAVILPVVSLLLVAYAWKPWRIPGWRLEPLRRLLTLAGLALLTCIASIDALVVARLVALGRLEAGFPLPFSLPVAALLGATLLASGASLSLEGAPAPSGPGRLRRTLGVLAVAGACTLLFSMGQMFCFGRTDYARRADVAVVFGARAYASGAPSLALADRVRTAVDLYHDGKVDRIVMSGGPGDGAYHETQVMKTMAVHRGVPAARIDVDRGGWSTRLTVANTVPMLERMGARRVLAVSHWFHLPRIKMEYERSGLSVYTVPARETRTLAAMPWYVMRESAVFWVYWSRPLVARPG